MAIQIQGLNNPAIVECDGVSFRSLRSTNRPTEYSTFGHYSVGLASGTMAAGLGAASEIFQFRWAPTSGTALAIIQRVRISAMIAGGTFFAAGIPVQFSIMKATSWSASGTGGTSISGTIAATCKQRTSMASSMIGAGPGDIRIATTAALGAGTKSFDAQNLASFYAPNVLSGNATIVPAGTILLESNVDRGAHPLTLVNNEGFSIIANVPATGTWTFAVEVQWTECAAY